MGFEDDVFEEVNIQKETIVSSLTIFKENYFYRLIEFRLLDVKMQE